MQSGYPSIDAVDSEARCTYDESAKSADLAQEPDTSVDGSRDTGSLQRFAPFPIPRHDSTRRHLSDRSRRAIIIL
jgi:hypothetical protein